tara:strand:+ start:15760 stop:16050 length:291 start_codon:yes stop_codon:yes gene_type:complete
MVKADEILKLSKQMKERREKRKASSPNIQKGTRLEVTKRRYIAMKENKNEMSKKNMELARQREMKKLSEEVNKMTLQDARRILSRMIHREKIKYVV